MIQINGYATLSVRELRDILRRFPEDSAVVLRDGNLKTFNITGLDGDQCGYDPHAVQLTSDGRID